jgi:hypothetical protein
VSRGVNLKKTPKILIIRIHFRFRFESLSIFLKRKHKKSYLPDFSTRSVDYWIFRKSRTQSGGGYDFLAKPGLTTAKNDAISAQLTNLVAVVVLVVKSKVPYYLQLQQVMTFWPI